MAAQAKISIYRQRKVTSIKQRRMEIANCLKIKIDLIDLDERSAKIEGFYNAR